MQVAIFLIQRNRHALIGRAIDDQDMQKVLEFLKNDPVCPLWETRFSLSHLLTLSVNTKIIMPLLSHCIPFKLWKVVDSIYDCKSEVIGPGFFRFKAEIGNVLPSLSVIFVLHDTVFWSALGTMFTKKESRCFILSIFFVVGVASGGYCLSDLLPLLFISTYLNIEQSSVYCLPM